MSPDGESSRTPYTRGTMADITSNYSAAISSELERKESFVASWILFGRHVGILGVSRKYFMSDFHAKVR